MKYILLISHSTPLDGPIDYLEQYLISKNLNVTQLSHPLDNYENRSSYVTKNTKLIKQYTRKNRTYLLNLLYDIFLSLKIVLSNKYDTIFCANNFDAVAPLLIKYIFFKKYNIVYFASDFSENRFSSNVLNYCYISIEKFVLKHSDSTISNTKRAQEKRIQLGLNIKKALIIPNGVFISEPSFLEKSINKDHFIYVGSVTEEHGLYECIRTLSKIINKLVIIGSGDQLNSILSLCKTLNINCELHEHKSHEFVIDYLQKFEGIGLAPYNNFSKWTYYCSPLKVNEYIACGVPVLISSIPEISQLITKESYGMVYDKMDAQEILNQIDQFSIFDYNKKAKEFYESYNYMALYSKINDNIFQI